MTDAFRSVTRGLRVAHVGFLLTCWGAVSATVLGWLAGQMGYGWRDDPLRVTIWIAFWTNVVLGAGGAVTGIVGRVKCLSAPPEFPAVRGRAIAAVVLEASGWLSGFVGVGIMFAMGYKWLPQEFWVPSIGFLFSGLLLLCGRILLLRFLRVLARVVNDRTTERRARLSLTVFLLNWGVALIGVGVSAFGSALGLYEMTNPIVAVLWIAGGMSGLAGLVLYDRVLGGLTRSVHAFADIVAEEDEESETEWGRGSRERRRVEEETDEADDRPPKGDDEPEDRD